MSRTSQSTLLATALFAALLAAAPAYAQSAEKLARVEYATAQLALRENRPADALEGFESVIQTMGQQPVLLYYAGEAAFQAKLYDESKNYADRALAIEDAVFEASPEFQKLIELAARLKPQLKAQQAMEQVRRGFVDLGGGVIRDSSTGLNWTQSDNGQQISWQGAQRWCAQRGDGWRLPSADELQAVVEQAQSIGVTSVFKLSGGGFIRVWSGTQNGSSEAWAVYLNAGHRSSFSIEESANYDIGALCVRSP